MADRVLKVRGAAVYECEEWSARIEEDDEFIHLFWKDQPFSQFGNADNDWPRDVLEPLAIVIHAALQGNPRRG